MKPSFHLTRFQSAIGCAICLAALVAASQVPPAADAHGKKLRGAEAGDAGEKVFAANCSRCHTPPMTLRPSATGAVIAHMRVRARLTQHDQQLLLKYLAP